MQQCCTDCFKICQPFVSCPVEVFIMTPPGDYGRGLLVNIVKPGVNVQVQQLLDIDPSGFVEVDMDGLPDGFFNPWGGQYTISFTDPDTGELIEFEAKDNKTYSFICFSYILTYSNLETNSVVINAINDEQP